MLWWVHKVFKIHLLWSVAKITRNTQYLQLWSRHFQDTTFSKYSQFPLWLAKSLSTKLRCPIFRAFYTYPNRRPNFNETAKGENVKLISKGIRRKKMKDSVKSLSVYWQGARSKHRIQKLDIYLNSQNQVSMKKI